MLHIAWYSVHAVQSLIENKKYVSVSTSSLITKFGQKRILKQFYNSHSNCLYRTHNLGENSLYNFK